MSMPSISQISPFFQMAQTGIGQLGQGLQQSYQQQNMVQLGQALQSGDYAGAMGYAARSGNPELIMKIASMKQDADAAKSAPADLAALTGGGAGGGGGGGATAPTPAGSSSAPTAELQPVVTQATSKYNLDPSYVPVTLAMESAGGRNLGTRGNPGQFDQATANRVGIPEAVNNPYSSVIATGALADTNAQLLQAKLGRPPTPSEVYLAHQQGPTGAANLILHPDWKAADAVGSTRAIAGNIPGVSDPANLSAGQFVKYWDAKYNATAAKLGYQPGASIYTKGSPSGTALAGAPGAPGGGGFGVSGFNIGGQPLTPGQPPSGVGAISPSLPRVPVQGAVRASLPPATGTVTLADGTTVDPADPDAMAKLTPAQKVEVVQKQTAALPASSAAPATRPTPAAAAGVAAPAPVGQPPPSAATRPVATPPTPTVTPSGMPTQPTVAPQPRPAPSAQPPQGGLLGGLLGIPRALLGIPGHLLSGLGGLLQGQGMQGFGAGLPGAPGPQAGAQPAALPAAPAVPAAAAPVAPAAPAVPAAAPAAPPGGGFGFGPGGAPMPAAAAPAVPAAAPVASAANPDPPVTINGKQWTRASASADDSPSSPSVADVAKAQGVQGDIGADESDDDVTAGLKSGEYKYGTAAAAAGAAAAPGAPATAAVADRSTATTAAGGMSPQQRYQLALAGQIKYAGTRYAPIFEAIAKQAQEDMSKTSTEKEWEYAGRPGTFSDWVAKEKTPQGQLNLQYARDHWQQLGLPDPNSTNPADVQTWRNYSERELGLIPSSPLVSMPPAETAEQKKIGEERGALVGQAIKEGQGADDQVRNLQIVSSALDNPDLVTGPYGDQVLEAGKFFEGITGIPSSATDAGQVLAKMNTQLAAAAGRAMSSRFTQQEFAKLKEAYPGLTNTPDGNKLLVKILIQDATRKRDLGQIAASASNYADYNAKKAQYDQQNPLINPFTNQPFGATDAQGRPLLPRPTSPTDPVYRVLKKGDIYIDPNDGKPHVKPND